MGLEGAGNLRVLLTQAMDFEPIAGDVADAHHGPAADRPAVDFEVAAGKALHGQPEGFAARAQPVDAGVHLLGDGGRKPGAEPQDAPGVGRIGDERQVALDVGIAVGASPGDDDLRLGGEKHVGTIEFGAHRIDVLDERDLALHPTPASRQVAERGQRHEKDQGENEGQAGDVVRLVQTRQECRALRLRSSCDRRLQKDGSGDGPAPKLRLSSIAPTLTLPHPQSPALRSGRPLPDSVSLPRGRQFENPRNVPVRRSLRQASKTSHRGVCADTGRGGGFWGDNVDIDIEKPMNTTPAGWQTIDVHRVLGVRARFRLPGLTGSSTPSVKKEFQ